ncbi:MAG: hypothetical protein R3C59_29535 [Planctomycetaceae bacterium]
MKNPFIYVGLITGLHAMCSAAPQPPDAQLPVSAYVQRMMTLDRNRDGHLSADELPATLKSLLTTQDGNGDQRLSPEELAVQETATRTHRDPPSDRPKSGRQRGGGGGARPERKASPLDARQILRFALTFDVDQDGGLNATELQRYADALAVRRGQARTRNGTVPDLDANIPPDDPQGTPAQTPAVTKPPAKGLDADGRGDGGFGDEIPQK